MEERRKNNDDMMFLLGEIHEKCKRIPEIEKKMEIQDNKIDTCRKTSRVVQASGAVTGGLIGGFIAVLSKRFLVG